LELANRKKTSDISHQIVSAVQSHIIHIIQIARRSLVRAKLRQTSPDRRNCVAPNRTPPNYPINHAFDAFLACPIEPAVPSFTLNDFTTTIQRQK